MLLKHRKYHELRLMFQFQIIDNVYLFRHHRIRKRSLSPSPERHADLASDPEVTYHLSPYKDFSIFTVKQNFPKIIGDIYID